MDDGVGAAADDRWATPARVVAVEAAAAAVFLVAGSRTDRGGLLLCTLAAALLAALAVSDGVLRPRLAAGPDGLVLRTLGGRRRLPWSAVRRARVEEARRLGLRQRVLEVDAGDELHVLSARQLGADPETVARRLTALRTGR